MEGGIWTVGDHRYAVTNEQFVGGTNCTRGTSVLVVLVVLIVLVVLAVLVVREALVALVAQEAQRKTFRGITTVVAMVVTIAQRWVHPDTGQKTDHQ